jgi:peptide/nickel transport system ATP-binding protein
VASVTARSEMDHILEVSAVSHRFRRPGHTDVLALDQVNLRVAPGEVVGLVGESGSGKTTLGRAIVGLLRPESGTIVFEDHEITSMPRRQLRRLRARLQIVFQDPYASLNPRMTVEQLVAEPLKLHTKLSKEQRRSRVIELLELARLPDARLEGYPHQFSGGQLQRVNIARALATSPALLVLDEPTASLDAHTRRGVLDLLESLRRELGLTYVLISHDLASVNRYCDRVVVLYRGRVVEAGSQQTMAEASLHPYTNKLMAARLGLDQREEGRQSFWSSPSGVSDAVEIAYDACQYSPRCPLAESRCIQGRPPLDEVSGHLVACIRAREIAAGSLGP